MATQTTPTVLQTASVGQAPGGMGVYQPGATVGASYYERYYPLRRNEALMRAAQKSAEGNPYIARLEILNRQLATIKDEADAREKLLQDLARQRQAQAARMDQARLVAAGKRGGGGFRMKDNIELLKVYTDVLEAEEKGYTARLESMDASGRQALANSFGTVGGMSTPLRGALSQVAARAGTLKGQNFKDPRVIQAVLSRDAEGQRLVAAARTEPDIIQKQSDAAAFQTMLTDSGMSDVDAAKTAADVFGMEGWQSLMPAAVAEQRKQVQSAVVDLPPAGVGEGVTAPRVKGLIESMLQAQVGAAAGDGGAAYRAELKRQQAKQLTPEERRALDVFLGELRRTGELPTGEAFKAGQAAYRKAKQFGSFRVEEAQFFDDQYIEDLRKEIGLGQRVMTEEEKALARAERSPEQIQRDMSEQFIRSVTAAEGLEVVPTNFDDFDSPFKMRTYGGALDIVRKEGDAVFDPKAAPEDRTRRLGGKGPLKTRPHRAALRAFEAHRDPKLETITPEALSNGVAQLRKQFKGNPDAQRIAVSYFMAMNMVRDDQQRGETTAPAPEPTAPPPVPTPAAPAAPPAVEPPPEVAPAGTPRARAAAPAAPAAPPPAAETVARGPVFPEVDLISGRVLDDIADARATTATYPDPAGPGFVMGQRYGRHQVMSPELQARLGQQPPDQALPPELQARLGQLDLAPAGLRDLSGLDMPSVALADDPVSRKRARRAYTRGPTPPDDPMSLAVARESFRGGPQPQQNGLNQGSRNVGKVKPLERVYLTPEELYLLELGVEL